MITLSVATNIADLKRRLSDLEKIELPFATAMALNQVAFQIGRDEQDEMRRVFRNPTRWTLGTVRVDKADKSGKPATVYLEDFGPKGTPAAHYLQPQIGGGGRGHTPFENRLIMSGLLSPAEYLMPARWAETNAAGNLNPGQVAKILSDLGTVREALPGPNPGRRGRRAAETYYIDRGGQGTFFGRPTSNSPPGIYLNKGARRRLLVFVIVRQPQYRAIFKFREVAQRTLQRDLPRAFREHLDRAVASSRFNPARLQKVAA